MKTQRLAIVAGLFCAGVSASPVLGAMQQLELGFNPVGGVVTAGAFPLPATSLDVPGISGTLQLFQSAPTSFDINVNQTGTQFPGFSVQSLDATIVIANGNITSAFFSVIMNDGSFFQAVGDHGDQAFDLRVTNNIYEISGAITNFSLNGPTLAGVDVSGAFAAQPLIGSFFNFSFTPDPVNNVDFDTQLNFTVMSVPIPLPSGVGLASVGLMAVTGLRRRRTI